MQASAVRWGFDPTDVGLVTGNRRENPSARVLVVVAEILLNRLLHREGFDLSDVAAVVMDEFHSFTDPERGIVWELSLGLLPPQVRTLLLSATVGNATEFIHWLRHSHDRNLELVKGEERKTPLSFHWVGDRLLTEQLEEMARGDDQARRTPALVFCFNRDECWAVAEAIKGRPLLEAPQQARLAEELKRIDWSQGAGQKLRQLLIRGVGVHHAGLLPKHRRIVEDLFQRKLLSVAVCTETLSSGINLPARSVVLPTIMKGPPGKMKVLEPSAGAPDLRPRRPAPVRHGRLRLRLGPRGRRADRPLGGKVQPNPRGDEGPGPVEGAKGPGAEAAETARLGAVLEPGAVPEAGGLAAGQTAQPRTAPLAPLGLHARRLAGGRSDPHPGGQAADGFAADRIGPARPRSDAAGAAPRRIRATGAGAARRRPAAAGTAEDHCVAVERAVRRRSRRRRRKSRRIGRRWPIPRANWRS